MLLLAIGLGFLIGRTSNKTPTSAASSPAVRVTVQGGGGGGSGTTAASTADHDRCRLSNTPKGLSGKLKKAAAQTAPPSAAVQKKATQAASKVLGNSKNLASPTVTTGGSCTGGAGCQGHKFTGNFFGN